MPRRARPGFVSVRTGAAAVALLAVCSQAPAAPPAELHGLKGTIVVLYTQNGPASWNFESPQVSHKHLLESVCEGILTLDGRGNVQVDETFSLRDYELTVYHPGKPDVYGGLEQQTEIDAQGDYSGRYGGGATLAPTPDGRYQTTYTLPPGGAIKAKQTSWQLLTPEPPSPQSPVETTRSESCWSDVAGYLPGTTSVAASLSGSSDLQTHGQATGVLARIQVAWQLGPTTKPAPARPARRARKGRRASPAPRAQVPTAELLALLRYLQGRIAQDGLLCSIVATQVKVHQGMLPAARALGPIAGPVATAAVLAAIAFHQKQLSDCKAIWSRHLKERDNILAQLKARGVAP